MRAVLMTPGVFHHFALARELDRRGQLERIFTTFPWFRVRRESVPRDKVSTFPWVSPLTFAISRRFRVPRRVGYALDSTISITFDSWCASVLPACDVLIALSGSSLRTGLQAREQGALYLCDRGSSHFRYQVEVLAEEYRRWGVPADHYQAAALKREEAEYEAADYILVPSEFSYRSFVEMGVPRAKLRKVVLAADVKSFYPVGEPAPGQFTVLYAGQVSFRKGVPYLLEAFARLRHPRKTLRLLGRVEDRMRRYLETAPLDNVIFDGPQPLETVRMAMSTANVLVLPSIEDGFGMVMGEAMACGTPVISSVNTGGADLFPNGEGGVVVPIRDPEALCAAMQRLADDPHYEAAMRAAAYARMQTLGGWAHYGDAMESLLQQLLQERAAGHGRP